MLTKGWNGELPLIALISWTCLLRGPPECVPLTGQRVGEELSSDCRLERTAVIGFADRNLVVELNDRLHVSSDSRLARVCVSEDSDPTHQNSNCRSCCVRCVSCGRRSRGGRQLAKPSLRAGQIGGPCRSPAPPPTPKGGNEDPECDTTPSGEQQDGGPRRPEARPPSSDDHAAGAPRLISSTWAWVVKNSGPRPRY